MSDSPTILVPVDFSKFSRAAVERALGLASASGSKVKLLHVLQLPPLALEYDSGEPVWSELRSSERKKLEELGREFEGRGVRVSTLFEEGDPASVIHAAGCASDVEMIIMGSHGLRGLDRILMGSVAERTVHSAPVPVMIVRESEDLAATKVRKILFATDFSESSVQSESVVARWARDLNAEVEVMHVVFETTVLFAPYAVPDSRRFDEELRVAANRRMEGVLERFRMAGVQVKTRVVCGFASEEILERADSSGAQVIAMGTRGHTGLRRLRLGSVVQRVLRHASCSVLVAGFASGKGES